jgi:hypothetical protein
MSRPRCHCRLRGRLTRGRRSKVHHAAAGPVPLPQRSRRRSSWARPTAGPNYRGSWARPSTATICSIEGKRVQDLNDQATKSFHIDPCAALNRRHRNQILLARCAQIGLVVVSHRKTRRSSRMPLPASRRGRSAQTFRLRRPRVAPANRGLEAATGMAQSQAEPLQVEEGTDISRQGLTIWPRSPGRVKRATTS